MIEEARVVPWMSVNFRDIQGSSTAVGNRGVALAGDRLDRCCQRDMLLATTAAFRRNGDARHHSSVAMQMQ